MNVHHYDGTLSSGYQYELTVKTNADVKVSVDGDGYFTVDNNELNNPSARKTEYTITTRGQKLFYFKNDNYNIEITNKYAVVEVHTHQLYSNHKIISPVFETFDSCVSLQKIDFEYTDANGDIKWLSTCPALKEVFLANCNAYGNIESFSGMTNIEVLRVSPYMVGNVSSLVALTKMKQISLNGNTNISGDITSFSGMTNIELVYAIESPITGNISSLNKASVKNINFQDASVSGQIDSLTDVGANALNLNFYNNIVGGSVEGFVGSKAVPSAPIYMLRLVQYATFGGETRTEVHCHLGWESSSKIYVLAGSDTASSCTKVYCKGYTQSEAEIKWPGKTIVRVDA